MCMHSKYFHGQINQTNLPDNEMWHFPTKSRSFIVLPIHMVLKGIWWQREGSLQWHSTESWMVHTEETRLVLVTLDPMARYKQSIWSQVCSSHTIQLMDVWIFGAVGGKEGVSWKNSSWFICSRTVSLPFRATYQKLHLSDFALFYLPFSLTASPTCQSAVV